MSFVADTLFQEHCTITNTNMRGNLPTPFAELSLSVQKRKMVFLQDIRANWGLDVEDCIPASIHPRKKTTRCLKPKITDAVELENDPRNWSFRLLDAIRDLSRRSTVSLTTARDLLETEVRSRQGSTDSTVCNRLRLTAELTEDDIRRVMATLDCSASVKNEQTSDETDARRPTTTINLHDPASDASSDPVSPSSPLSSAYSPSAEPEEQLRPALPARPTAPVPTAVAEAAVVRSQPTRQPANEEHSIAGQIRMLERKAEAKRLRAEAAEYKAEALELEANADELRLKKKRHFA
ncbi:hypothetical protein H2199_007350 [Coniosporium tulheliwenetii]|uniref:Uncharacterized protein n=1 Tax=Coniosporium tulheliwenetii TaxID=3383036 RepID=A0ACC2YRD5_9PEZI|nr:hypothetical protein H2199_007350 [Cladosporium sp. JES 115]